MGTSYHIKLVSDKKIIDTSTLKEEITYSLNLVDRLMSTYKENSEVSRFNRHKKNKWFPISKDTYVVIKKSLEIAKLTDGIFDPTIGSVVDSWGFGPQKKEEKKEKFTYKNYQLLKVAGNPYQMMKTNDGIQIDLSAIAKGYAVDQVAKIFDSHQYKNYYVEIGGELRVSGHNHQSEKWRIGIEMPTYDGKRKITDIIHLNKLAMATSGDYRNFFMKDGKVFSHIINPKNSMPKKNQLMSVSILSEECMEADALATALMVMGDIEGPKFAKRNHLHTLFLINDHGKIKKQTTGDMPKYIKGDL